MIGSPGNLMFKLHISPRANICVDIKFPRATYHTIVPSTEELYYLNNAPGPGLFMVFFR